MAGKPEEELLGQWNGHHCRLTVGSNTLAVEVTMFGASPQDIFDTIAPERIVVTLQDRRIATLIGLQMSHRSSHLGTGFAQTTYTAAWAAIGPREFGKDEQVTRLGFTPTNELISIFFTAYKTLSRPAAGTVIDQTLFETRSLGDGSIGVYAIDSDALTAVEVPVGNVTLALRANVTQRFDAQGGHFIEHRSSLLSYNEPVEFQDALQDAICLCDFCTVNIGMVVGPQLPINVTSKSPTFGEAADFKFFLRLRPPAQEVDAGEASSRCLISHPIDGEHNLADTLRAWLDRRVEWRPCYRLSASVLALNHEISPERFLAAARWFEAVPLFYFTARARIPTRSIQAAAKASAAALAAAASPIPASRLQALLAAINAPSFGERVRQGFAHVFKRFGPDAVPASSEDRIPAITKFRGAIAHGDDPLYKGDIDEFYEALLLLESLTFLLLLSATKWEYARLSTSTRHPLYDNRMWLLGAERRRTASA